MRSNVSASSGMPNSCAMAGRCISVFVEPEIAACTMMAFSNDFSVTMSDAFMPFFASATAVLPASSAATERSSQVAGISAVPGSMRPSDSAIICMVDAVPMNEHAPQEGHAWCL